ncbi:esterase family protein [Nocardia sp. NEAU-G5]|uniref:Esterase family protein n=1 Tax=Nocardia albiluteola TaxID=2842303 RepID=A0ABS6AZI0_9NOCA|nr:alpha/beta hydrolase-fold protein [Nocardia albiluteola]MBU3062410.1 esterase family protein [Nocardia albiluteola]
MLGLPSITQLTLTPPPPPPPSFSRTVGSSQHAISLLHGWLPPTVEIVALVLAVLTIGWRTRRWRLVWLPISVAAGVLGAFGAHALVYNQGWATGPDRAPSLLWVCAGGAVGAVCVAVLGWTSATWWRRGLSALTVVAVVSSLGIVLDQWVGYFPTVQVAWNAVTEAPLPHETPLNSLPSMRGQPISTGRIVPIQTPDTASGMHHRTEYVYLPPAWFARTTPPRLPVVMMIGGEFATPDDWIRIGNVLPALDRYATQHGGWAPIFVFVDTGGTFTNDTECVDGPRDHAATHLTADVPPYVEKTFGTATSASEWAVAGWSMGGTCAIDLTVMHPSQFGTFVDIAGDIGPNAGNKQQTIARLYGGSAQQWAAFDPRTVMAAHRKYTGMTGLLYAFTPTGPFGRWTGGQQPGTSTDERTFLSGKSSNTIKLESAAALYTAATRAGIDATLYRTRGNHTWQAATGAFDSALPWLSDHLRPQ